MSRSVGPLICIAEVVVLVIGSAPALAAVSSRLNPRGLGSPSERSLGYTSRFMGVVVLLGVAARAGRAQRAA